MIDEILLENKLSFHQQNKINNILLINNWLLENVKRITEGETIIDFHPINNYKQEQKLLVINIMISIQFFLYIINLIHFINL